MSCLMLEDWGHECVIRINRDGFLGCGLEYVKNGVFSLTIMTWTHANSNCLPVEETLHVFMCVCVTCIMCVCVTCLMCVWLFINKIEFWLAWLLSLHNLLRAKLVCYYFVAITYVVMLHFTDFVIVLVYVQRWTGALLLFKECLLSFLLKPTVF